MSEKAAGYERPIYCGIKGITGAHMGLEGVLWYLNEWSRRFSAEGASGEEKERMDVAITASRITLACLGLPTTFIGRCRGETPLLAPSNRLREGYDAYGWEVCNECRASDLRETANGKDLMRLTPVEPFEPGTYGTPKKLVDGQK